MSMTNIPERDAVELALERGTLDEDSDIAEMETAYFAARDELVRNGKPVDWQY